MSSALDIVLFSVYTEFMKETIVNCVNELRLEKNIRQEDLAQAVGVTRQTIIAVEGGNYIPSVLLALKIANFFNKSLEKVFQISYEKRNH